MHRSDDSVAVLETHPKLARPGIEPGTAATAAVPNVADRRAARRRTRNDTRSTYVHLDPLLLRFAALNGGDLGRPQLRAELVVGFQPVVVHVARRYRDLGEPSTDLEQVGTIGLMGALDRYDPGREINFLSFAVPTITGEIRRHFRDRTWSMRVPRRLKDLQGPVREAVVTLTGSLGRTPRPGEIAALILVPVTDVVEALRAQQAYTADSLDALARGSDTALTERLGRLEPAMQLVEHRDALKTALSQLPERERQIVVLRFFDDLTQTQIAARVGLSQMHISRLLARSLTTLRVHLGPD